MHHLKDVFASFDAFEVYGVIIFMRALLRFQSMAACILVDVILYLYVPVHAAYIVPSICFDGRIEYDVKEVNVCLNIDLPISLYRRD
jgi:hypothetical protein